MDTFNRVIWTIGAVVWTFNAITIGGGWNFFLALIHILIAGVFWVDWMDDKDWI